MSDVYPPGIGVDNVARSVPTGAGQAALLLRVTYAPGSNIPLDTDAGPDAAVSVRPRG